MAVRVASPELIGRDTELSSILSALEDARVARGRAVLISGEAGVGKSRLLDEALERARATALVLSGGCIGVAEGTLPFAPIIEAIRPLGRLIRPPTEAGAAPASIGTADVRGISGQLVSLAGAGETADAQPRNASGQPDPPAGTGPTAAAELRPEWARSHVYEAFLDVLRRLAAERPVVLAIEDLQWADSSSRELLAFLIRNTQHERVLLLVTFRSDELHRRHPLLPWIVEIGRLPHVARIELERLGREHVARQLAGILGHRPDPAFADRVFARSEGNPFFVEELVAAGEAATHLPTTLREVLAGRLGKLSDPTTHVLGVAALIGRRIDHDVLMAVSRLADDELDVALEEAVIAQILVTEPEATGASYAFRHGLLAEAAAEMVLPGQRRRLHADIGAALEARADLSGSERAGQLVEVAHHWFEARELDRAFIASCTAAEATVRAGAYAEALHQYERAVELWEVVDDPVAALGFDRVELLRRTAQAAQLAGAYSRAVELLGEAVERSEVSGDRVRTGLLLERVGRSRWTAGAFGEALDAYQRALDLVPAEPPSAERAQVLAGYAQMLMLSGRFADARAVAEPALEVARATGARQVEGHLLATLGAGMGYADDADDGVELIRTSVAIAEEIGDLDDLGRAYAALSSTLDFAGRREEGVAVALEGAKRMSGLGMGATYGAFLRMNAADDLIALGRWDEALGHMRDVESRARGTSQMLVQQELAQILTLRGDVAGAARAIDALAAYIGHDVEAQFTGPISASRIALATLTGDTVAGRAVADRILPILAQTDDLPRRVVVLVAAVQLEAMAAERARAERDAVAAAEAVRRAERYTETLRGLASGASAASQRRMHERALALAEAELGRVGGRSDPEAWRRAIEAGASDAPVHETAYAQFRLAEAMLVGRSARDDARALLERARTTAIALGAQPLQDAIEALATRARLALDSPLSAEVPIDRATGSADAVSARSARPRASRGESEASSPATRARAAYGLTPREIDVLHLLALGRTNRQIGEELFMSESTAGVHVSRILGKLDVGSRVEAATIAARLGLAE